MRLPGLFPADIDCFRLLETVAAHARERAHLTQEEVASKLAITQPTVGTLENLTKEFLRDPSSRPARLRRIGRHTAFRILSQGLELPSRKLNAMLWLLDGSPLSEAECKLLHIYEPDASPIRDILVLRAIVLELLAEAIEDRHATLGEHHASVRIRFNADEEARLREAADLLEFEKKPGQRLVIAKFPSSLTNPPETFDTTQLVHLNIKSDEGRKKALAIHHMRHTQFLRNLETFGERTIHSKEDLRRYLKQEEGFRLNRGQRLLQIKHLLYLLKEYPYFQIALSDTTPQLELGIKNKVVAVLRGAPRDEDQKSTIWGLHHIFFCDCETIFFFFLRFEQRWEQLSQNRNKDEVIGWLQAQIDSTGYANVAH